MLRTKNLRFLCRTDLIKTRWQPLKMKSLKIKIFFLIFTLSYISNAQNITYNHIIDSTNLETQKVMKLFEDYLASNPQNQEKSLFWNLQEQKEHKKYDFLESEFQPSLYMGFPVHVLSIKSKNGIYEIKAQFGVYQENGQPYVLAIANYFAKKENGNYRLYNALTFNKKQWLTTKVGLVDFYYPKYHKFNLEKAEKLNDFIKEVCKNFDVKPKPFEYYLADDFDEIQSLKGFDYYIGMGGEIKPSGKATDNKVYCGGLGEYYPHEVFHVLIDEKYPNNHYWVSEGMATFLGGSRGEDLDWHLKRTNDYLQNHPEINLNNLLELVNLDEFTSYHYSLGGLIAKKIYEKGGWTMVKEFMNSGKSDDDYYNAIEKYLGIKRSNLNTYLRKQLKVEAQE